jgi:hypothetical protein
LACLLVFVALVGPGAYSFGAVVNPAPGIDPYANVPFGAANVPTWGPGGSQTQLSQPDKALIAVLRRGASSYTWVAATVGADPAAGYQLATGDPAMAIGGWSGTDPVPTLTAFQYLVSQHRVHYFIAAGNSGGLVLGRSFDSSDAARVTAWVESHFKPATVDGLALYDLSQKAPDRNEGRAVG